VSENDNCHCAGITEVAAKVTGRNAWRGKPRGDLRKQIEGADAVELETEFYTLNPTYYNFLSDNRKYLRSRLIMLKFGEHRTIETPSTR